MGYPNLCKVLNHLLSHIEKPNPDFLLLQIEKPKPRSPSSPD